MIITLPSRNDAPATNIFVNIITMPGGCLGDRNIILLVPGGPGGNHTVFNAIQNELLKYGDLVLFDPRGCGQSEKSEAAYCSINHYVEDIEAIRKHFCLESIILLGGSYGAMASIGYAVKYSKYINKLILIGGAASYRFLESAKENLIKRGTPLQVKFAQNLFNGTFHDAKHFKEYYQATSSLYMINSTKESLNPPTISNEIPYNIEVTNFGFGQFLRKFNYEKELKNIRCETLVIVGDQDWINDPVHAKYIAEEIPHAQLKILKNCGHFVWADQRVEFLESIERFVENTSNMLMKNKF